MKRFPLPNLDGGRIRLDKDWSQRHWFFGKENEFSLKKSIEFDFLKGWGNKWPDLPNPDEHPSEFRLDEISLSSPKNRCSRKSLLGYYLSWHIVGVSFANEKGRQPRDGEELKGYNDSLPNENRFGIHICCSTIESYIKRFSTDGLEPSQIPLYLDYCTFLTLIYVIAHEWGHYRSQIIQTVQSL